MMKTKKAIDDKALTFVAGGNTGDSDIENEMGYPMYSVGEDVEVFLMSFFHIHTKHAVIIDVRVSEYDGSYLYRVMYDSGAVQSVFADDIERK